MAKTKATSPSLRKGEKLSGLDAPLEVRRHPAARRLTLRVSRTRRAVIVTLPMQCDIDEAGSFVTRHMDWIRARLDSLPTAVPFRDGILMPLRGETHAVRFRDIRPARGTVACRSGEEFPELTVGGDPHHAPRRLRDWLFEEARRDLDRRVAWHAGRLGVAAKRIVIRDQASRWGSCSTTGALSFSWRLILAPPPVLDYVAAHEVAHLSEMNHGPRFWALVRKTMPDFDLQKRWLQIYGMDLHRYGSGEGA